MKQPARLALLLPALASADPGTVVLSDGFTRPVALEAPAGIDDRLWVVEQGGAIWIIDRESGERLSSEPFLDLRGRVRRQDNEEGLLGLAFAPDFAQSGRFYLNYTDPDQLSRVVRLTATGPDFRHADPAAAETLLDYRQPYGNHNGGWLGFGPDGLLYIGTGDGGAANDPQDRAQDLGTLLGKMLRIDVSGENGYRVPDDNPFRDRDGARPEIWALGLRNPWRCSFDRETREFWIADVGQNRWEEINVLPAGEGAGANFGWRLREGDRRTPQVGGAVPEHHVEPVYTYDHGNGPRDGLSVTGGYVYRGPVEELRGRYLFADYQNQRVWSFVLDDNKVRDFQDHSDSFKPEGMPAGAPIGLITSFGQDNQGDVYLLTFDGRVLRITG